MPTVTSKDGTSIAYSAAGTGPALIVVDGACCYRDFGPANQLVEHLRESFTVYTYDRRGRGESTDTKPYDLQREVEDIAALLDAAGGSARVFGQSSGGALALEAANAGLPIDKLAVYEVPFIVDPSGPVGKDDEYESNLSSALDDDRRGDAVKLFMSLVEAPGFMVQIMRLTPAWSKLKQVAHTLPYDHALLAAHRNGEPLPADRFANATMPALAMAGGKSDEWFRTTMRNVAERLPQADYRTIDGQNHMLKAKVIAPTLKEFLS